MNIWILVAAIVATGLTLVALLSWIVSWDGSIRCDLDDPNFSAIVDKSRVGLNEVYWMGTVLATVIAFIWIWITGFHWNTVVAFVWPYTIGYMWSRVIVSKALKRRNVLIVPFALLVMLVALGALLAVIDVTRPFLVVFSVPFGIYNIGADHLSINGYTLLGSSGLVLVMALLLSLLPATENYSRAALEENKKRIEENERKQIALISDEALRQAIIQGLNQGKKVTIADFPYVKQSRIQKAMAELEEKFADVAFTYDAAKITLVYRNAEGIRRLYETSSEITREIESIDRATDTLADEKFKETAKALCQLFLTELGLSDIPSDAEIQLPHRYFPMCIGRTRGIVRGLPAEFPIFVPLLNEQQMREENMGEIFRQLFQAETLACNSGFGLVLSPSDSPYLRSILTQRDEDGVKENVAYLNREDMQGIITSKNFEPRNIFLIKVAQQVSFALISPFHTRGVTPGAAFVGRDRDMSNIIRNIGLQSYAVLGARRIGKTSLITQVTLQLRRRKYSVFYLDCQAVETYHDFFRNIRVQWADYLETFVFTNDLPITFQETVAYLAHADSSHQPLVFIFDEIDELLKFDMSEENKEKLFKTFRDLSQQNRCQFIFSGERRIYYQMHNSNSPLYNFPTAIKLGIFSLGEAQKLIEEPLAQFGISLEDGGSLTNIIVDACSRHPNLLQEMGHRIFELIDQRAETFDQQITKEVVSQVMMHPDFKKLYLETFRGQSNELERAITLFVSSEEDPIELAAIAGQLKQHRFMFSQQQFDTACDFLMLYCIFQQDATGLRWAATHFKEIANETIFDQEEYLAELRERWNTKRDDV